MLSLYGNKKQASGFTKCAHEPENESNDTITNTLTPCNTR